MASRTTEAPRPLDALAARVSAVADELPERERTALALREREGARYSDIAGALGVEASDVPGLLVAARLEVREGVRSVPLPPILGDDCPRARRLLAMKQDGELRDERLVAWLRGHTEGCLSCRTVRLALREASLACRAWDFQPVIAPAVAEPEVAEPVVEEPEPPAATPVVIAPIGLIEPATPAAGRAAPARTAPARRPGAPDRRAPARRSRRPMAAVALVAAVGAATAVALAGGGGADRSSAEPSARRSSEPTPAPTPTAAELARARRATRTAVQDARDAAALQEERYVLSVREAEREAEAAAEAIATAQPPAAPEDDAADDTGGAKPREPAGGGDDDATGEVGDDVDTGAPVPAPTPEGDDIIPPPGDEFCSEDSPDCESG